MVMDDRFDAEHASAFRCLNSVLRLRWFDPEPSSQPRSVDRRYAALIIATLFFNIHFWFSYGNEFWMFCPILPYALLVAVVSALTTALFFVAPAVLT